MTQLERPSPLLLPSEHIDSLENLVNDLGLPEFDLLLVGRGCGTVHTNSAGWSCVSYDARLQTVTLHAGATTGATCNFVELYPYVHALWSYQNDHPKEIGRVHRVSIISDSEVTVRCGNGQYRRRANGCLWAAIEYFERSGYVIDWRHVRHGSNDWNAFVHATAGAARGEIIRLKKRLRQSAKSI